MTRKILYGGCWFVNVGNCHNSYRLNIEPDYRNYDFGFRLIKRLKS